MPLTLARLRADAIRRTLFPPTTLRRAITRLGFIQADPIRSPARAQDLILRHRVVGYHAGDLERRYPALAIEEDVLYAYGFIPRSAWQLLHPRDTRALTAIDRGVLEVVTRFGRMHPRELESHLGRARSMNAWGGYSKTTTRSLQALHYRGLLRIAGRENGIRIYEPTPLKTTTLSSDERARQLVLLLAAIFAPVPFASLRETMRHLRYSAPGVPRDPAQITRLLESGDLNSGEVDGLTYVWPAGRLIAVDPSPEVRFLAPFDPLVWDRRRFEHLFGWRYRFEAYTPPPKRVMGYYAMPVLWLDQIVGWANATTAGGTLKVELGFIGPAIQDAAFKAALDREIDSLSFFLGIARCEQETH